MAKLSTHGDFPVDLIESAKAELAGELNFAEQSEPSVRSGSGYPSLGNVLGHGFDFGEPPVSNFYDEDLRRLRDQLKIVSNNIGRGNDYGSKARAAELRLEIRDKLAQHKRNVAAAQSAVGEPEPEGSSMEVETDNRGALIPDYNESAQEALDFARCQRPDGSFYGTGGVCRKGSPTGAKEKEAPKGRKSSGKTSESSAKKAAPKASASSDMKSKRAEVREMDKTAKAANKAADKADKKFQKSKSPADGKEARRLDKIAKSADREANKADKELQRMAKSASNDKGRAKNVKINEALASGNKSRLRSAQAEVQKRIASLEKKGQPVPKPLQATAKLLKSRLD